MIFEVYIPVAANFKKLVKVTPSLLIVFTGKMRLNPIMPPPPPKKNAFEHCAETLWSRKLKLCDFLILVYRGSKKVIFSSQGNLVLP